MTGFENATAPVGGSFWRALGQNGSLVIGYALVVVHVAIIVTDAIVSPALGYEAASRWGTAALWSTILTPLLAMCFIWIGELIRRGDWGGPSGHKPEALLPQGSNTVTTRMVPLSWHAVWAIAALAVAVTLLVLVDADRVDERFGVWTVNGIIAAGAAGAILGSALKKWTWWRRGPRATPAPEAVHPALARRQVAPRSTVFWRWVGFRWRFDLWCCALGLVAVWLGALMLVTRDSFSGSADSATLAGSIVVPAGAALFGAGLWATTQFWRAGEDLAGGESVA